MSWLCGRARARELAGEQASRLRLWPSTETARLTLDPLELSTPHLATSPLQQAPHDKATLSLAASSESASLLVTNSLTPAASPRTAGECTSAPSGILGPSITSRVTRTTTEVGHSSRAPVVLEFPQCAMQRTLRCPAQSDSPLLLPPLPWDSLPCTSLPCTSLPCAPLPCTLLPCTPLPSTCPPLPSTSPPCV